MPIVSFVFLHQAKRFSSPPFFCSGFPCHCNSLKLTVYGEMLRVLHYTFFAIPPPLLMDKCCTVNWVQFRAPTLRVQLWNAVFPYMLQTENVITEVHVKCLCITSFLKWGSLALFIPLQVTSLNILVQHLFVCFEKKTKISLRNCPIWIWFLQQLG